MKLLIFAASLFVVQVSAHGRLTNIRAGSVTKFTRKGAGYENDPVRSNTAGAFVCRNPMKDPYITLTAGETAP